jgi:hypothetical protein
VPKMTPPSCQALSQGMNHGFMATTLRQNKCRHNGRRRRHLGRRRRGKSSNVKTMLIAFFDAEGLVHHKFLRQRLTISDCLHNRSATPSRCSSSKTASQMIFRYLASAPRQCTMPRGPECHGILGQAQHPHGSPPALLTRFGPLRLLPLPQAEEHPEGETISRRRGDTTKYDMAVASHSQTSLPHMH